MPSLLVGNGLVSQVSRGQKGQEEEGQSHVVSLCKQSTSGISWMLTINLKTIVSQATPICQDAHALYLRLHVSGRSYLVWRSTTLYLTARMYYIIRTRERGSGDMAIPNLFCRPKSAAVNYCGNRSDRDTN